MIICFFYIFIWKYLYDWRFHCIALLHKFKLTRTRQMIDLEQVWYMYSIALPYCCDHAWRNMAYESSVASHWHWIVTHSAYTHTVLFWRFSDIIFLWFGVHQKYYLQPFNLIIFIYYNCILARINFISKMPRSAYEIKTKLTSNLPQWFL